MDEHKIAAYQKILDCLEQPALLTRNGSVILCNQPAVTMENTVKQLLQSDTLPEFCSVDGINFSLAIQEMDDCDLILASPIDSTNARMASVARSIRAPLASLFSVTASLLPYLEEQEDPRIQSQTAQLNRGLYQLFRAVGNMEAVSSGPLGLYRERTDLVAFLSSLCERADPLCEVAGLHLEARLPRQPVTAYLDAQRMERAILNLLSNAIRFSDKDSTVIVRLDILKKRAVIRVDNAGEPVECAGEVFRRSEAEPGNPKYGAGLGLTIVREIARMHGGALMFQPLEHGFSASLSLSLEEPPPQELRSPMLRYDYAGGFDHLLLELADVLPSEIYNSVNIN